jgi:Archaeal holliday junction resolvase (hjc)
MKSMARRAPPPHAKMRGCRIIHGPRKANPGSGGAAEDQNFSFGDEQFQLPQFAPKNQAPKRGGSASRDKGNRFERSIVRLLQDHGLAAERVPLSGAAGGSYLGDLTVPVLGRDLVIEAKAHKDGFRELYSWLEDRDSAC